MRLLSLYLLSLCLATAVLPSGCRELASYDPAIAADAALEDRTIADGATREASADSSRLPDAFNWTAPRPTDEALHFGGTNDAIGRRIVVDASGDIIVTGRFTGKQSVGGRAFGRDDGAGAFVARFSAEGILRWLVPLHSAGGVDVFGLAQDTEQNVFVTGHFSKSLEGPFLVPKLTTDNADKADIFVLSVDKDGERRWFKSFGGDGQDTGRDLILAESKVVITGALTHRPSWCSNQVNGTPAGEDAFVAWLDRDSGECSHLEVFAGPGAGRGRALLGDSRGGIVLAGKFEKSMSLDGSRSLTSARPSDIYLLRMHDLTSDGTYQLDWGLEFGSSLGADPHSLAMDAQGNIALTGSYRGHLDFPGGTKKRPRAAVRDGFVASFTADGAFRWATSLGGAQDGDAVQGIVAAPWGFVVGGHFRDAMQVGTDRLVGGQLGTAFLVGLDASGTPRWGWDPGTWSEIEGVTVGPTGAVFATGRFSKAIALDQMTISALGESDMMVLKLAP